MTFAILMRNMPKLGNKRGRISNVRKTTMADHEKLTHCTFKNDWYLLTSEKCKSIFKHSM